MSATNNNDDLTTILTYNVQIVSRQVAEAAVTQAAE
jgi:hypothetical protein